MADQPSAPADSQPPATTPAAAGSAPHTVIPGIPPGIPPQLGQQLISISAQQWMGPIPPPGALEQYERIIPGSAERLVRLTEKEQAHRHEMEKKTQDDAARDVKRGQYLGGTVALAAVGGAIYVAASAPTVGIALVGVPVGAMIYAIVKGRPPKK